MRNRRDTNQVCTGLIQNYIGTAYDIVKEVYDNLDYIKEIGERLGSLEYYRKLWLNSAGEFEFEWEHDTKTLMVYLNGSLLVRAIDYQADGETITLTNALIDNSDMLEAYYSAAYDVPGCVDSNTYFSEQGVQDGRLYTLESSDTAQNTKINELAVNDAIQNTDIDTLQLHAGSYLATAHVKTDGLVNQVYTKFSSTNGDHGWANVTGLERKAEAVSGTGNVEDDVNAYTFVGSYAEDGVIVVHKNTIVSLGHDGTIYDYIGPSEVEIGAGAGPGTYAKRTCVASDFLAVGIASHGAMSGRSDPDQHPQSSITDLITDQTAQDNRLTSLEAKDTSLDAEQAVQDTRLDNLEAADVTNDVRVGVLESRVDTIDTDQVTQNGRLDVLEPKVTALETSDSSQDTKIDNNASAILALQTNDGVQDGRLDVLEANDSTQDTQIGINTSNITNLQTNDGIQDGRLDTLETNDPIQDSQIATNTSDITDLETANGVQDGRLDAIESDFVSRESFTNYGLLKFVRTFAAGNDLNDPTITSNYNTLGLSRQGVGLYRLGINQSTFWGINLTEANTHVHVTAHVTSSAFHIVIGVTFVNANTYDIQVRVLDPDGAGQGRMGAIPYDLQIGDTLHILGWFDAGDGTLPPVTL